MVGSVILDALYDYQFLIFKEKKENDVPFLAGIGPYVRMVVVVFMIASLYLTYR